jgi:hypothetical protein
MRYSTFNLMMLAWLGGALVLHAQTRAIDFSSDTTGQPPKGFLFGHTAKVGAPGR